MRILAVDLGMVRTGIAVCDKREVLASPLCTIQEGNPDKVPAKVLEIAISEKAEMIVVGHPKNMDGSCGESAKRAERGCVGEHKLVSAVKDWAKRNATEGRGVYDAASELKYAPDYLTRIFKKHTGKTTLEYINGVRLQKAKSLLLNTDLSVSQIAYSVGFADEKYFMRLFKREESVTPTQYRTSHVKRHLN